MELAPSVDLDITHDDCFVFAEHDGLFEPLADLGASVEADASIAQLWPLDRKGSLIVLHRPKIGVSGTTTLYERPEPLVCLACAI